MGTELTQNFMGLIKSNLIFIDELKLNNYSSEYYNWLNDIEVNQYLESRYKIYTDKDVKKYITQMLKSKNDFLFGIFLNSNKKHIGNIKIGNINYSHNFAEIGLMIGNKNYWGKGIGTESIWCVAKYSFEVLKLNKIIASMYETNIGSYKSFLKVGFNEVGRCKNHYLCDGSYIDKFIVELFNNEIMKI